MIEVTSIDKFPAPGHLTGMVYTVPAPYVMKRDKPEIIGQTVKIDGEEMLVSGVERHLPNRPIEKGEIIGLWVKAS